MSKRSYVQKQNAVLRLKYVFSVSKRTTDTLYPDGQPASFAYSLQILNLKSVELSSELNGERVNDAKLFIQYGRKNQPPSV